MKCLILIFHKIHLNVNSDKQETEIVKGIAKVRKVVEPKGLAAHCKVPPLFLLKDFKGFYQTQKKNVMNSIRKTYTKMTKRKKKNSTYLSLMMT